MIERLLPIAVVSALLALAGCAPAPESYAPPFQRSLPAGPEPRPVASFVNMGDPDADSYILRDVSPGAEGDQWRWTFQRPELRFWLESKASQQFVADISLPEATFRETGPVTISFFVNGNLLVRQHCPRSGDYHIRKEVPATWLRTDTFTIVAAESDKHWVSPADGARLGFILTRIGFVP